MISQYEVHSLLEEKIPQLVLKTHPSRSSLEIYACINDFTDYTKHIVKEHDYNQAKKCFAVAENLYLNGDKIVRLLIENSFVYSFSSITNSSRSDIFMVNCILPETLYKVYRKQVLKNAIEKITSKN